MAPNAARGQSSDDASKQPITPPPFPLTVDPFMHGWCVTVHLENGQRWRLLKPGWTWEVTEPYVFETPGEAWEFLRKMFQFCARQQNPYNDRLVNCAFCGKVYRARFLTACEDCTTGNEDVMAQLWQGFYFTTGSYDEMIMRIALALNITPDRLAEIRTAYAQMVSDSPRFVDPWQMAEDRTLPGKTSSGDKQRPGSGRRRQYGIGSR